jgi:ABC-type transport system substrate-binding protein
MEFRPDLASFGAPVNPLLEVKRKKDFDRVQEIVAEQAPVIFLIVKNSLSAHGRRVANVAPSPFFPYLLWSDWIWLRSGLL